MCVTNFTFEYIFFMFFQPLVFNDLASHTYITVQCFFSSTEEICFVKAPFKENILSQIPHFKSFFFHELTKMNIQMTCCSQSTFTNCKLMRYLFFHANMFSQIWLCWKSTITNLTFEWFLYLIMKIWIVYVQVFLSSKPLGTQFTFDWSLSLIIDVICLFFENL